jgi:FkbM family methyltransferase
MRTVQFHYDGKSFSFTVNENDYIGHEMLRQNSFYAIKELEMSRAVLHSEMTVIDCGANIGNHSVYFSKYCKIVYAIEPFPGNFQLLQQNSLNSDNIVCYNSLLSDQETFYFANIKNEHRTGLLNYGSVSYELAKTGIKSTTLDAMFPNTKIGAIKIDTEGMELKILLGARKILTKYKPRLMIETHSVEDSESINELLFECGYSLGSKTKVEDLF